VTQATNGHAPKRQRGVSIDIDGVTMVFNPETNPFQALMEISLSVKPGEFVSVVGPSGCGKSTLMLLTAGLLRPSTGEIRVDEERLESALTDVGVVFQDDLLLEFRTAEKNVSLQGQMRKLDMDRIRERTGQLMEQLGVAQAADKYPKQLSGGMRQRVAIARALVHDPSVLLMDEPFGALDALTRLQVRHDLEQLWMRERPTVLFITHSVEEAVGLSDRVIVFSPSPGRIVEEVLVDLPRPRPLALGETAELAERADGIYRTFEEMGVLSEEDLPGETRSL
jgi:NitT/TauT family transport system ATP-binding protein